PKRPVPPQNSAAISPRDSKRHRLRQNRHGPLLTPPAPPFALSHTAPVPHFPIPSPRILHLLRSSFQNRRLQALAAPVHRASSRRSRDAAFSQLRLYPPRPCAPGALPR